MPAPIMPSGASAPAHLPTSLLPPPLRRDLADLNALYLELGLGPGREEDPRFCWSTTIRQCLHEADPDTRSRVAAAPFALFDLALPEPPPAPLVDRVEDSRPAGRATGPPERCESFAQQAAFFARRLVEGEPLAAGVVLGLSQDAQQRLADYRLPQLAELAHSPDLIRPRWRLHGLFWQVLVGAARRDSAVALQWAFCIGLCLLDAGDVADEPRRPRPRARR